MDSSGLALNETTAAAAGMNANKNAQRNAKRRGLIRWLRSDRVLVWTVALLLGAAIARLVNALAEDMIEPALNRAFGDPNNDKPTTNVFGANLKVRHFAIAIIQFLFIVVIAYALSKEGTYEPARYTDPNPSH